MRCVVYPQKYGLVGTRKRKSDNTHCIYVVWSLATQFRSKYFPNIFSFSFFYFYFYSPFIFCFYSPPTWNILQVQKNPTWPGNLRRIECIPLFSFINFTKIMLLFFQKFLSFPSPLSTIEKKYPFYKFGNCFVTVPFSPVLVRSIVTYYVLFLSMYNKHTCWYKPYTFFHFLSKQLL